MRGWTTCGEGNSKEVLVAAKPPSADKDSPWMKITPVVCLDEHGAISGSRMAVMVSLHTPDIPISPHSSSRVRTRG